MVIILVVLTFSVFIGAELVMMYRKRREAARTEAPVGFRAPGLMREPLVLMQDGGEPIKQDHECGCEKTSQENS